MSKKLKPFTEVETKYDATIDMLMPFKRSIESIPGHTYLYAQGPDNYFTKANSPFLRLRAAQYLDETGNRFIQLTSKSKPDGAKNNVFRREPNLKLDGNNLEEILNFINMIGYTFNFRIFKYCHIYKFEDATIVFYTVILDGTTKENHYIEIEVDEKSIHELTEQQAWKVIEKYEKVLGSIGINAKKRKRLSLFEMYKK